MSTLIRAQGSRMALVALASVGAALLALFVLTSPALSGQINATVTKTADTNDGSCTFDDCSLREAIIAANAGQFDEIDIPAGTYKLTIEGPDEDLAATGDLDIRRGVSIRGAGARDTIIDGNGIDRVFDLPDQGTSTPFIASIIGIKITGGAPPNGTGGGISHFARGATLNLSESTVSGNSASQGGGIDLSPPTVGTMNIVGSTISGNKTFTGGQGGGIQNVAAMTLENTTVSGNKSTFGGGIEQFSGTLRVADSTIASNTANSSAGGISFNAGTTNVKNAIVSNNKAKVGKNCGSPVTSQGNNLEKGTTCGFTQPTDLNADPLLGKLGNNGGPTNTRALQKGSPAIDAGGMPFPPNDQRGAARPRGTANDIGAYEKQ